MRTHSRERIIAAIAAITLAGLATGCSSGGDAELSDEPMTLRYAIWDKNQEPSMKAIITAFTKKHPNVTIKIENAGDKYFEKLQTSISGGAGPDVFWMNGPNFQLYAANGQLEPLDVKTADYPESLVELYSFDGKTYGAPKDFDTIGVWYNKELFDAAGVEYPAADWTWADYHATAAALTDPAKGVWGSAAKLNDQSGYYNTVAQAGGYVIDSEGSKSGWASPEAQAGIDFWIDQIKAGVSPNQQQMTDTHVNDMFTSGKIAMYWDGSWNASLYAQNEVIGDKLDVAPLPAGAAGNMSVVHGISNVVNAASKNKAMAEAFALFASGEEASTIQAESGTVIPAFNGTQDAWVAAVPQYDLQVFMDAVETAVPYPVSKNTSAWGSIQSEILTQVWALTLPASEALPQLAEKMQGQLDKDK